MAWPAPRGRTRFAVVGFILAAARAAIFSTPAVAQDAPILDLPVWADAPTPAAFRQRLDDHLSAAQRHRDALIALSAEPHAHQALRAFDDTRREIDNAEALGILMQEVHPDSGLRATGQEGALEAAAMRRELWLDRAVYDVLARLDAGELDEEARHYLRRALEEFRRGGVDRDAATRGSVRALRAELDSLAVVFSRNIAEDQDTVLVGDTVLLRGMPADWLAAHSARPDGSVVLTLDYPDVFPVLTYAEDSALRRQIFVKFFSRAAPQNLAVLELIVSRRHALAAELGYGSWGDLVIAGDMAGSAANASRFVDEISDASKLAAARETRLLLDRMPTGMSTVESLNYADWFHLAELVRRERYGVDARELRPYFPYTAVKDGILALSERLFGLTFRPLPKAPVWHPAVEAYEAWDGERLLGRFYLDMHPRPGKFSHAALFAPRVGVAGRQLGEAALVCNFPAGAVGQPGLLDHGEVITFLHEFGHLLHVLLSSDRPWFGTSSGFVESDFVEAPSQMLEEWGWRASVLGSFARHHQTGEPLPAELLNRVRAANEFGKALRVREQLAFARISLALHEAAQAEDDPDSVAARALREFVPFVLPPEPIHLPAMFGHLGDETYSAAYYLYMWSSVIAKDLFTSFEREGLLDAKLGRTFRRQVLERGASAPAAELVEDFLGRPFGIEAWAEWLNAEDSLPPTARRNH